jgi:hypothetical protein
LEFSLLLATVVAIFSIWAQLFSNSSEEHMYGICAFDMDILFLILGPEFTMMVSAFAGRLRKRHLQNILVHDQMR